MNYRVETEQPTRLDIWLSGKLGRSRSQVQKLIKSGVVLVNGRARAAHFEIKNGDEIEVRTLERREVGTSARNIIKKPFDFGNLRSGNKEDTVPKILFKSPDYLIVEKPIGMVVHPDAKHRGDTLIDALLETYPEIKHVGDAERPGVVHRLDKEVSGLLVVARNQIFYGHIKRQFDERTVSKEYVALVFGEIKNSVGTILFKLVRSKNQEKYVGLSPTSDDLDAKDAETQYEVVAANQHYSLVKLFPKTGRTHQLRVHLRTFGHPIAGDRLYELPHYRHLNRKFSRVMLHARRITFHNLAGESVQYESSVPDEMGTVIEDIFHLKEF